MAGKSFISFVHSINECNCIPWDMFLSNRHMKSICTADNETECFWRKINDTGILAEKCFCLSDCSRTIYPHFDAMVPLKDNICKIGTYDDEWEGYFDETGKYLGPYANWQKRLSRNVLDTNPITLALAKKVNRLKKDEIGITWENYETFNRTIVDEYYTELCKQIVHEDKAKITVKIEGRNFIRLRRSLKFTFTDKLGSIGGTLGLFSGFSLLAIIELIHWICKIGRSVISSKISKR